MSILLIVFLFYLNPFPICQTVPFSYLLQQETYGEDPYLTSQIVSAHIRGLQGNHSRYKRALDVCKHFDAHSGPEDIPQSRFSFNANVSNKIVCKYYSLQII